jgi:hypothetical protein
VLDWFADASGYPTVEKVRCDYNVTQAAVPHNELHSRGGRTRVQRHIDAAGSDRAKHCRYCSTAAREMNAYAISQLQPGGENQIGEAICQLIKFRIGEHLIAIDGNLMW